MLALIAANFEACLTVGKKRLMEGLGNIGR